MNSSYKLQLVRQRLEKLSNNDVKCQRDLVVALLEEIICLSFGRIEEKEDVIQSVVHLVYLKDVCIKKLVYHYIEELIEVFPSIYLQISNHVQNDLSDPNPSIRTCALRLTLKVFNLPDIDDCGIELICKVLNDPHPKVKALVLQKIPSLIMPQESKQEISSHVLKLLKQDADPGVVTSCISCLISLGSLSDIELLLNLVLKMDSMTNSSKFSLVTDITRIVNVDKLSHEHLFQLLNQMESNLDNSQPKYLSIACLKLMLKISQKFEKVHQDVKERAVKYLLSTLQLSDEIESVILLSNLKLLLDNKQLIDIAHDSWKTFLLFPNDSVSCRTAKLEILNIIVDEENALLLLQQATTAILSANNNAQFIKCSMCLIVKIFNFFPKECEQVLHALLFHKNTLILNETVQALAFLFTHYDDNTISKKIIPSQDFISLFGKITSHDSKIAYLFLITQQTDCEILCLFPELFDEITEVWNCENDDILMCMILDTITELFLQLPHVYYEIFYKIMRKASTHRSPIISQKCMYYYRMLKSGIDNARNIIFSKEKLNINKFDHFQFPYSEKTSSKHSCDYFNATFAVVHNS